ncbi:hypothetical protein BJF85_16750 [Saccharomonospora sp. CUA-673]|uniref:hypothetical protein n=1 Tax=Saccharomonospora sp. CUA-673 TaxID=1904969 RepID=UPI000964A5BE|nr:hypothetical protein [Saccharomonospora sp. CUA-673]OLT46492.1 hypothetical protein BJF85_16750 [Saccharomonospora sp. CUA-673]
MTFTATYDDRLGRVRLVVDELPDGAEQVRFERSTDGIRWRTVRGGDAVGVSAGMARLDDYEFAGNVPNTYRASVLGTTTVDTFDRTVSDGWGTADGGQDWSTTDAAAFDVADGAGTVAVAEAGTDYWATLDLITADADITVDVSFSEAPGDDAHAAYLGARFYSPDDHYFAHLYCVDTIVQLSIGHVAGGDLPMPESYLAPYDPQDESEFRVRFAVVGDTLRGKVWLQGEDEPAEWQVETTDTVHTEPGPVALGGARGEGTSDSVVVSFADLSVRHESDPLIVSTQTTDITPPLSTVWIKNIARPFLNRQVTVTDWSAISRPARGGTFEVVGRTMPVAVTDVRGSRRYELTITFPNPHDADDFDTVMSSGDPVFVHVPSGPDCLVPRSMYAVVGEYEIDRRTPRARRRYVTLPLTEVAAPAPSIVGATVTWQSIVDTFATWDELIDVEDTWESVAERIGDPDEVIVP